MKRYSIVETKMSPEIKAQFKRILKKHGLTVNEAITLFFHEVVAQGKLPFDRDICDTKVIEVAWKL